MSDTPDSDPPARSFCRATGLVFQTLGIVLALGTCCWWPITSCTEERLRATDAGRIIPDIFRDATPDQMWATLAVALSFVSGLALVTVGLGLQHERRAAARAAIGLTALAGLFYWCYLGFAIFMFPAFARIVIASVMAVVWTGCFLLAGASAGELKRHPPPKKSERGWTSRDEDDLRKAISPHSRDKTNP
jgi:hypothetical protein